MIISNIDNINDFNRIFIDPLKNCSSGYLLPCDVYTHHCLVNNSIDHLRQTTSEDYSTRVDQYNAEHADLQSHIENNNSLLFEIPSVNKVVFPFSKTAFCKTYYSNVMPSIIDLFFQYMKTNKHIVQIGSGVGKALIIRTDYLTQEEYTELTSNTVSFSELADLMVKITHQQAKQQADIEYLLTTIQEKENVIAQMRNEYSSLETNLINSTMYTWR